MTDVVLMIDGQEVIVPEGLRSYRRRGQSGLTYRRFAITRHARQTIMPQLRCRGRGGAGPVASCIARSARGWSSRHAHACRAQPRTILEMLNSTVDLSETPDLEQMMQDTPPIQIAFRAPGAVSSPFLTTIRCTSAITTSASCAGAVCRYAPTTPNTLCDNFSGRGFETGQHIL